MVAVGDDGVVCEGDADVDSEDFPPERVLGLGGGGFTRVDEDLDRDPGVAIPVVDSAVTAVSSRLASSTIGSETDRRPSRDPFELLPPLSVAIGGACMICPVNINRLNASASKDCRFR